MRVIIEEKVDGISGDLEYKDGILQSLVTRGDGVIGDDITPHAQHIRSIPKNIPEMGTVNIRGEIVLPLVDFKEYWLPKGAKNPRNQVSGLAKGRSKPEDLATLQFIGYSYYGPSRCKAVKTEEQVVEMLARWGFQTPFFKEVVNSPQAATEFYELYDKEGRDALPYLTDGIVVKIDDLAIQDRMPSQGGRPSWAVAVKPSPKAVVTKVTGITWEMGLSGRFSPVAQVEPRDLDGTTLKNVNLFNLDRVKYWYTHGFGKGAEIMVIRTGDVLPHLVAVVTPVPGTPAYQIKQQRQLLVEKHRPPDKEIDLIEELTRKES